MLGKGVAHLSCDKIIILKPQQILEEILGIKLGVEPEPETDKSLRRSLATNLLQVTQPAPELLLLCRLMWTLMLFVAEWRTRNQAEPSPSHHMWHVQELTTLVQCRGGKTCSSSFHQLTTMRWSSEIHDAVWFMVLVILHMSFSN